MNKKSVIGFMFVTIIFITGCGNNSTPTPTPEPPVIKIAWVAWPGAYPLMLIEELGLDVKHGVRVDAIFYKDVIGIVNDLETSKIQGSITSLDDVIKQNNRHPNSTKILFVGDKTQADFVVAAPDIKRIADLKGKRVGVLLGTTFGELMVQRMLEYHGLSVKDVELVNMDASDVPDAIPQLIDAGATWEPHLSKAKANGLIELYSDANDLTLPLSLVLALETKTIEEHPEAVRGLVAAWFEAVALWQADPEKYGPLVAKVVGGTAEEAANSQADFISLEQNIQRFADESLTKEAQVATDFLISTGQLNRAPDIKTLFDGSFLQQIKEN